MTKNLKLFMVAAFIPIAALAAIFNNYKAMKLSHPSFYDLKAMTLEGQDYDFNALKGKMVLIVNTASKCGFTPQFDGLEQLNKQYGDKLVILGFPSNDFGEQEPGEGEEISSFCRLNYGVTFQMMEKVHVSGAEQHGVYEWLTSKTNNGKKSSKVMWNFQKYLIDENGNLVDYYFSITSPTSSKITKHLK